MLSLKANVKNTVRTQKIQDFVRKSAVKILVGFPSGMEHIGNGKAEERIETAELAKELSFGSTRTPARPFLAEGIEPKRDELKSELVHEVKKAKEGGQPNFGRIGTKAVGFVQEFVRGDHYKNTKPNSEVTKEKKGSDRPLIDTAEMINSLTFIVEAKK